MSKNLVSLAFEEYQGPKSRLMVLMALAKHANNDGTSCHPNVRTLARFARAKRSTVQRELRILEFEGVITTLHRGGAGRGDVSEYQINAEAIKKSRNGNPFGEDEKGRNAVQKGPQRGAKKGRNGNPDSVIYSVNDSARVGYGGPRSGNGADARARKSENSIKKSSEDKIASPAVVEANRNAIREIIGNRKKD